MKTKNAVPRLPKLASSLVAVARRDLMAVRRKPKTYRVDMGHWHEPLDDVCVVCQAGAVMACTLGADPSYDLAPSNFTDSEDGWAAYEKLHALNLLRQGSVSDFVVLLAGNDAQCPRVAKAWDRLGERSLSRLKRGYVPYYKDPKKYLAWLKRVETGLRKLGI